MAFKMVSRKLRRRLIAPTISIGKAGLYLNRAAMDVIGTDKKAVILYFDSDAEPPQIGMWFHKDKPSSPHPHDASPAKPATLRGRQTLGASQALSCCFRQVASRA